MRKIQWIAAGIVALSASAATAAGNDEDVNNCVKTDSNQEWAAMAREHHENDTWQRLFALRVGLCAMVASKQLEIDRASRIFERQRQAAITNAEAHAPAPQNGNL